MKKLVLGCLLCVMSFSAAALEMAGAKLEDKVQVGNAPLVLSGAGLRQRFIIKVYVAGLYLGEKKHGAEAVLADTGAKRLALHIRTGSVSPDHFLGGIRKGIEKNESEQTVAALRERMNAFDKLFEPVKTVSEGDVMRFDWQPGSGTHVSVNNKEIGIIPGEDFYRALLKVWIGDKPVDEDLKKGLLGG
jgi:hypothetical protein